MWYSGNGDLLFCDNMDDDAHDSSYDGDVDEVSSTTTDSNSNDEDLSSTMSAYSSDDSDDDVDSLMLTD